MSFRSTMPAIPSLHAVLTTKGLSDLRPWAEVGGLADRRAPKPMVIKFLLDHPDAIPPEIRTPANSPRRSSVLPPGIYCPRSVLNSLGTASSARRFTDGSALPSARDDWRRSRALNPTSPSRSLIPKRLSTSMGTNLPTSTLPCRRTYVGR